MRTDRRITRACLWCGTEFKVPHQKKTKMYCTDVCAHKFQGEMKYQEKRPLILQAISEGKKPKHIVLDLGTTYKWLKRVCKEEGIDYESVKTQRPKPTPKHRIEITRDQASMVLKKIRRGCTWEQAGSGLGLSDHVLRERIYRLSKRYRSWKKSKEKGGQRKIYESLNLIAKRSEISLCDDVEKWLIEKGYIYKREARVGEFKRRCDFLIIDGLFRYAVEAKISSRTKDVDTCIGQALLSAYYLKAVPVCLFDSSVHIDADALEYCASAGIKVCTEKTIDDILCFTHNQKVPIRAEIKQAPNSSTGFWDSEDQRLKYHALPKTERTRHKLKIMGFDEKRIKQLEYRP